MANVSIRNVKKRFGEAQVLHGVSIEIPDGSFTVLVGPSGCGKSTLLRMVAGLENISDGEIALAGKVVNQVPPKQRDIAMVFQNYALFPHLSVADNITFGLAVRKVDKTETARRLAHAAELLGLTTLLQRRPSQLSGGQQQRVALGRALVAQTRVCLMDEPLSNLDAQLRQEMRHELRELQQRLGLTVVYVTHDQAEAMSMADQVVLLHKGRIEQTATPRALYARPASTFAARFIGTPAMNLLKLDGARIAGSDITVSRTAHTIGVRPEAVTLGGRVAATVQSFEYLGADLVLRCAVGSEQIVVRAEGRTDVAEGTSVTLGWRPEDEHYFDAQGTRVD